MGAFPEESKHTVLKGGSRNGLGKILPDLGLLDFGVVDVYVCPLG